MIPEDEARQTAEFPDHFVIEPATRSWSSTSAFDLPGATVCDDGFRYSSDTNRDWLSIPHLRQMISDLYSEDSAKKQSAA